MTSFGYLWIGLIIGMGMAVTISVIAGALRQRHEQTARNASWDSITTAVAASEHRSIFEVVPVSRGL